MKVVCMLISLVAMIISTGTVSESQCLDDYDCGPCEKCQAGGCVFQASLEDSKDECPDGECGTGFCNGSGTCGLSPAGSACTDDENSFTDDECDGAGTCVHLLNQWAEGQYTPRNEPLVNVKGHQITSQNNCTECHGDNVPDLPGKKT